MEPWPFMHVEPSLLQLNLLILVVTCFGSLSWHVTNNKRRRVGSEVSFLGFGLNFRFGLDFAFGLDCGFISMRDAFEYHPEWALRQRIHIGYAELYLE